MITFNSRVNLNTAQLRRRANAALQASQMQLDNDVLKDSNYYIPKDTGNLEQSSIHSSIVGSGVLYWNTPYARKVYYGSTINFSKDRNPNARYLWFEAAKASKKDGWIQEMKNKYRERFNQG